MGRADAGAGDDATEGGIMKRWVWLLTEVAYGKTIGRREFLCLDEARETARRWRSQNAGTVEISRVAVRA